MQSRPSQRRIALVVGATVLGATALAMGADAAPPVHVDLPPPTTDAIDRVEPHVLEDFRADLPPPTADAIDRVEPHVLEDLRADPFVEIDGGEIIVTEPAPMGPFPAEETVGEADGDVTATGGAAAAIDAADALRLHSRPGAPRTIFLDVDGHVTSGTAWNVGSGDPIVTGAYSREPAGSEDDLLSTSERLGVIEIWQRVADDFAPWEVDVTTEDPGVEALRRTSPQDEEFGVRIVITHDSGWYGSAGGAAFLYSFDASEDRPAFVFSDKLAQGRPKSVAEAAAHEAGHTLGLSHDGKEPLSYYTGHGSWAPIMGVGYHRTVTQWSRGEYPGATRTEDDLALIDLMIARRTADPSTDPPLGDADTTRRHTLSRTGATNVHPIVVPSGTATFSVVPTAPEGNLLAAVRLREAGGPIIASAVPSSATAWAFSSPALPAGAYSLEVTGVGWDTPDTGFTAYGSLGDYLVAVDATPGPAAPGASADTGDTTPPPADGGSASSLAPRPADGLVGAVRCSHSPRC